MKAKSSFYLLLIEGNLTSFRGKGMKPISVLLETKDVMQLVMQLVKIQGE